MGAGDFICPGDGDGCGEVDQGTCDFASGVCQCNLGWTGPDCTDATCCHLMVLVGVGAVLFLGIGALSTYLIFYVWRPVGGTDRSSKSSRKSRKSSLRKSNSSANLEAGTSEQPEPDTVQCADSGPDGSTVKPRRTAPAVMAGQRASQSTYSEAEPVSHGQQGRKSQTEPVLRSSAWGERPPLLKRSQTMADSAGASRTEAERIKQGMFDRSRTEPDQNGGEAQSAADSPPHTVGVDDRGASEPVKLVNQKLRDMMHSPFQVRKKTLKDLLVEHHPDKNSDEHATEVFQAVNNARTWFLFEPQQESQSEPSTAA